MSRVILFITGSLLILILLIPAVFAPVGYILYSSGLDFSREVQRLIRARGSELAYSMATVASYSTEPENLVILSESMKEVVQNSRARSQNVFVEEAFMVNQSGELLAHNDVALLASGADHDRFKTEQMTNPINRSAREPMSIRPVGYSDVEPPWYLVYFVSKLEEVIPDLRADRYHVAVAVHEMDIPVASFAIHLYLKGNSLPRLLERFYENLTYTLLGGFAAVIILWFFFTLLMGMKLFAKKQKNEMISDNRSNPNVSANRQMNTANASKENEETYVQAYPDSTRDSLNPHSTNHSTLSNSLQSGHDGIDSDHILDAIPLDPVATGSDRNRR